MAEPSLRGAASPARELMMAVLAQNWWAIGIRGVLGILFGLIALFLPGATMLSLVIVFAAYAFVDACSASSAPFGPRASMNVGGLSRSKVSWIFRPPPLPCSGRALRWLLYLQVQCC